MDFIARYDTLINNRHYPKGAKVKFEKGTDSGYINRLVASGVIASSDDTNKNADIEDTDKVNESADADKADESESAEAKQSAKGKNSRKK